MNAKLRLKKLDGTLSEYSDILSFRFFKEIYQPYTQLKVRFVSENHEPADFSEIYFYVDQKLIHHGLIDSLSTVHKGSVYLSSLASRGFTAQLMQNQIQPGFIMNVSVNSLMDSYIHIPYVTHEDSSDSSNYIYIKYGSSMWDGISALAYKLYKRYPYISGTNCVMLSAPDSPASFAYTSSELLSSEKLMMTTRLISDFHMEDIDGNYGTFDYTNSAVRNRGIVRHQYSELDKRFLYNPQEALYFYDTIASRAWKKEIFSYSGFKGEELYDNASAPGCSGSVSSIDISGTNNGITTAVGIYL